MAPILRRVELAAGWSVRQTTGSEETAGLAVEGITVPGVVHQHLDIPPPFKDLNEQKVKWIGEKSWTYSLRFELPITDPEGLSSDLVFQGLDTFATVRLNNQEILRSDNMFIEHRVPVGSFIQPENKIEIVFDPARARGLELVKEHPEHRFIVHQTEVSRAPVRKAQYHWGWDWGPILMTCGPWKPILLETYLSRIDNVQVRYELSQDLTVAEATVLVTTSGQTPATVELELSLAGVCLVRESAALMTSDDEPVSLEFTLDDPLLWWPHGYGDQILYDLKVNIFSHDQTLLDENTRRIGFRQAQLIQDNDEFGKSFYFRINNVDVFAGGSCWVPADSFLPNITREDYRQWAEVLRDGQQVMVRIWGGGIYEADAFYEACDELGVLVWQDFAFACATYPTYPDFVKSVEEEARQNVRRLRDHPSLVVWAGNNEDYQLVERYNLNYDFDDKDTDSWLKTDFPARYFYEYLLPKIVSEETPGTAYHPSSPFGNGKSTTLTVDPTVGDVHQWNMWHGEMQPYQKLAGMGGRFVSEFGMEAYPHRSTLEKCISDPAQLRPGSKVMELRNKAVGHAQRLLKYVGENFQIPTGLDAFGHITQVMQADAISTAYQSWRRQWGRPGSRKCGGVLVWQLNDCWPTISWAVVDYYKVKKPAYYAMKRALAPIAVGISRKFHDWTMRPADDLWKRDTGHIDPGEWDIVEFDVWIASSLVEAVSAQLTVRFISIATGKDVLDPWATEVEVAPNGTTDVQQGHRLDLGDKYEPFVIHVCVTVNGTQVSTYTSWPEPIKYLELPDPDVDLKLRTDKGSTTVDITVDKPTKGFVIAEETGWHLTDNGFDLVPGERKAVELTGSGITSQLNYAYVGAAVSEKAHSTTC